MFLDYTFKEHWKSWQRRMARLFLAGLFTLLLGLNAHARDVDLELILAVDVSSSMDEDERERQRRGYIEAFRSTEVLDAIMKGRNQAIAVTYFEWSGTNAQKVVAPWSVINSSQTAHSFADLLATHTKRDFDTTSISGAMLAAQDMFGTSGTNPERMVLDISGDGPNNQGPFVDLVRDQLISSGIVINGLPMLMKPHDWYNLKTKRLDQYYVECVIGGSGAFIVKANSWIEFPEAIQRKLVLEISKLDEKFHSDPIFEAESNNLKVIKTSSGRCGT